MKLPVTGKELADCIARFREVLAHKIRDCGRSEPPADGAILTLVKTIELLESGLVEPRGGPLDRTHPE
jgi:hypothetical protein